MKKIILILIIGLLASCGKNTEFIPNENLLGFQSSTIMDMDELIDLGEENYEILNSEKFNQKTDTVRFEKELIYISYLSIVNGCANYAGDIEIKNDSIILKLVNKSGIGCSEQRVDRLIYNIMNTENKEYHIKKR